MYNLKDTQRRQKQEEVISKLKDQHLRTQKEEIFEDHDDEDNSNADRFNEMRETKTGFGAKQQYQQHAEGGLEPDEEEDSDEDVDDDGEDVDVDDGEEDDDQSDHNF